MKQCVFIVILLFSVLFTSNSATAQRADVPISFQIAIIKQIMIADRIIKSKSDGLILIVKDAISEKKAELMANAFIKQGIKSEVTDDPSLYNGRSVITIYYMTDTIVKPDFIQKEKVLTIALNSQFVEEGEIALAIRSTDSGRPEIVVSKREIELEGHGNLISHLPKAIILQ